MASKDVVVIGASAGGVEALSLLVSRLPPDLPAALFVVLHVPAHGTSVLPRILQRAGPLPAVHPRDGDAIQPGHIYVAPPGYHLLVKPGHVRLSRGPTENGHRPAVDALFRSAARVYGPRCVGVVLSGALDDGTAGLATIKARGGVAIAQDPDEALYSSMPRSAIDNVGVDDILPLAGIAARIARLAHEPAAEPSGDVPEEMEVEDDMAELESGALHDRHHPGTPSGFGCPDCGGVLWELQDGSVTHFRCRVGHAWSADSLLARQTESLEEALWTALRALEESAALSNRLEARALQRGTARAAERFAEQSRRAHERAEVIREVLLNGDIIPPDESADRDRASEEPRGLNSAG